MIWGTTPELSDLKATFDISEQVADESYYHLGRELGQIHPPRDSLSDVIQLGSGVWCLKPINTNLFTMAKEATGHNTIIRLSAWEHAAPLVEIPMHRRPDEIPDLTASADVAASGDHFLTKRHAAGDSWNVTVSSGYVIPNLPTTPHYPLDLLAVHSGEPVDTNDMGYLLRIVMPGHKQQFEDYAIGFVFGGELTADGYGLFFFTVGVTGHAHLYEWISGAWSLVDDWQFASWHVAPGQAHVIRIIPHALRFIEFKHATRERTSPGFGLWSARGEPTIGQQDQDSDVHVYKVENRDSIGPFVAGQVQAVTGGGHPRIYWNRQMRGILLQVARIVYPASGYLIDDAFSVRWNPTTNHALDVKVTGLVRYLASTGAVQGSLTPTMLNALTGSPLSTQSESYSFNGESRTINGWQVPGHPNAVRAKIAFATTNFYISPWLFGYTVTRRGNLATIANSATVVSSSHNRQSPMTELDISGQGADPSTATAEFVIEDYVNRLPFLRQRADVPVRIDLAYDPAQPTKRSVIWEGYCTRVDAERIHADAARTYPSSSGHIYRATCMGKWKRLAERDWAWGITDFAHDPSPSAPPNQYGQPPPWKVTDVIRFLLQIAGHPETQIDVPDRDLRLWFSPNEDMKQLYHLWIGDNLYEHIKRLASDYLDAFLVRDPNAGTVGKWRLRFNPTGSETPLWTFSLTAPGAGKLSHLSASYGANTTWVDSEMLESYPVPPEANHLTVTGIDHDGRLIPWEFRNPKSYNRPGESTADTTDVDYIGHIKPIIRRPDPTLRTLDVVQWIGRRIFERACRGQQFVRFAAPLVFVDPGEPSIYTTYERRPLQFMDPVTFDGSLYFVRSVHIGIRSQHDAHARYELQKYRAPLSYS